MNIFWLDNNLRKCAQYHNDKHIVKMPLELAQLMCTALHWHGVEHDMLYKPTHVNHPCAVWVRSSMRNYIECLELFKQLLIEYEFRYGRKHKCGELLQLFIKCRSAIPNIEGLPRPKCMPDKYHRDSVIDSYREYYIGDKKHLASWTNRTPPYWWRYEYD